MKVSHVIILSILVFSCFIETEAKKKKKTKTAQDRRPLSVEALLYCNSCQAVVREVLKKVKDSHKEYDISDALSKICSQRNFSVYEYPPPDMIKGCEAFIGGWTEEVELALIKRQNNNEIEDYICQELTNACEGVNKGARKGNDDYITINGKKVKMNDDGRVDINMQDGPSSNDDL